MTIENERKLGFMSDEEVIKNVKIYAKNNFLFRLGKSEFFDDYLEDQFIEEGVFRNICKVVYINKTKLIVVKDK